MAMTQHRNAFCDQKALLSGRQIQTIFDIGAHTGETVAKYAGLFPETKIYAFEPLPEAIEELRLKFQGNRFVNPVQAAVSDRPGKRPFYVNRNSVTNSLLPTAREASRWVKPERDIEAVAVLEVPVTSIDDFCTREGIGEIQILKMDIQGGELMALRGAVEKLRQGSISLIHTEILFVPVYEGQAYFYDIAAFLSGYGYELFDMYDFAYAEDGRLRWGDAVFIGPQLRASQLRVERSEQVPRIRDDEDGERVLRNRQLRPRRPAISDDGFNMPGFAGHYYMWPEEYTLLAKYVDLTQGHYLEIGSMCGIIAMSLAEKYPDRNFVCVDAFLQGHATIAGEKETFLRNLREHNLKNVTLIEGDSLKVVPTLKQTFDVIFIDGNHAYEYVLGDALNSWRVLSPGGFLIFHDYECVEETTRAVQDFVKQTGACLVEGASCLVVACKPAEPFRRSSQAPGTDETVKRLQDDVDSLRETLKTYDKKLVELDQLEKRWKELEQTAGWRMLDSWRRVRSRLAPDGSLRRKLYDALLRPLRGGG